MLIQQRFYLFRKKSGWVPKFEAIKLAKESDADFQILLRSEIHYNKIIKDENINYEKFNFLFPELGWWESHKFATDNFYTWSSLWNEKVILGVKDTRGKY